MFVERCISNVFGIKTGRTARRRKRDEKLEPAHIREIGIKLHHMRARQRDLCVLWYLQLRHATNDIVDLGLFSGSETIDRDAPDVA